MEKFTEFNLEIALQKPHLVRHKSHTGFRCVKVERKGGYTGVSWLNGKQNLKRLYPENAEANYLHLLVEEPEQVTNPEQLESVLQEAERLIGGQRAADYGSAVDIFANIAKMWSVIMGVEFTAVQVAHAMIALKLCRSTNSKGVKRDDWVDICGYAQLGYNIANQVKVDENGN